METTIDGLLNRRIKLEQPARGYRVAVDTVLLAASVPAQTGERALDLGCGVGGAMLCLAARVPGMPVRGIEADSAMAELCRRNIARNLFADDASALQHDATDLPAHLTAAFDHVLMNPPFHDEARHDVSDDAQKRAANTEKTGDLPLWIASAARALKPGGCLTLIHRADREAELLESLAAEFGALELLPVAPKQDTPPKRILLRARKGAAKTINRKQPLILHTADGSYTPEVENILRHAAGVTF